MPKGHLFTHNRAKCIIEGASRASFTLYRHGRHNSDAPCGVNFGSPLKRKYTPEYASRKKYDYDAARTFLILSHEELIKVADTMGEKLNGAHGPVKVLIPLGG
ncbi:MAG: Tm-1-like ATP-binding domain-containing protein [Deltaproteobacteria bacterium]|nr:Tm-1-like ATP-binding domain-containing protein [Deltaproteobacteria bacterium]